MELMITAFAVAGVVFVVSAPFVALVPYVGAGLVALIRRDPGGAFVPRRVVLSTRIVGSSLFVAGVILLVAVQPRLFQPSTSAASPASMPTGDPRELLVAREAMPLVESGRCVGMVVGIVDPRGSRVFGFGRARLGQSEPPDGRTVYEIGSITQVFTTLLLEHLAGQGVVGLDQAVGDLLPDSVSVPTFEDQSILVEHLATQRSGLPIAPGNLGASPLHYCPPFSNPWAGYKVLDLYNYLSSIDLERAPGARIEESELAMGLLGHALARAGQGDFETLVEREICEPLGLHNTRWTPAPDMQKRMAQGYVVGRGHYKGWRVASPAHRWEFRTLAGAAGLSATGNDMVRFLGAQLGLVPSPLGAIMAETRRPRYRNANGSGVALGWFIARPDPPGMPVVWHHGATGGFRSWAGIVESRRVAVFVLASTTANVERIGMKILQELAASAPEHPEEVPAEAPAETPAEAPGDSLLGKPQ
jgi:D-alanyl-D-alanine-carboxypeptidase/D-alanyl-D-alanine-endopeptidase